MPIQKGRPIKIGGERERISFTALIESSDNYVLSAPPESGKTSLLKRWAIEELSVSSRPCKIPIKLKFRDVPAYSARFASLLKSKLPDLPSGVTVKSLIERDDFLFLIDDASLKESPSLDNLKSFIKSFKNSRFVITTSDELIASPGVQPKIGDELDFVQVRMRPLGMKQIRQLVAQHGITDPADNERLIGRLYDEMKLLSVPATPVNTTFLIQIYKSDSTSTFVNRASLIERFVEILLDRYAIQDIIPGSFDFKNKTHVLAYIAQKMVESENYSPTEAVILSWLGDYLGLMGFRYTARDLLSYFLSARVLKQDGDLIEFKLRAFFAYFCALRMDSEKKFRDFVLDEKRYLNFPEEIGFYSAISRDDADLLILLQKRFESSFTLRRPTDDEDSDLAIKVERLRDLTLPGPNSDDDKLFEIEDQIFDRRLSEEERDKLLYGDTVNQDSTQRVVKPQILGKSGRSLALLIMASSVLRHTDLISNDLKKSFLVNVLDGWSEFTLLTLTMVPALATKGEIRLDGIKYKVVFPSGMERDGLARMLYIGMPISVGRMAFYHLGSEKLISQLVDGIGEKDEPIERQLLRFFILADLGYEGIPRLAKMLNRSVGSFRYLANVMTAKLQETLLRLQFSEEIADKIREAAADMAAQIGGSTGPAKARTKGKIMQGLKQHELALRVKFETSAKKDNA